MFPLQFLSVCRRTQKVTYTFLMTFSGYRLEMCQETIYYIFGMIQTTIWIQEYLNNNNNNNALILQHFLQLSKILSVEHNIEKNPIEAASSVERALACKVPVIAYQLQNVVPAGWRSYYECILLCGCQRDQTSIHLVKFGMDWSLNS